VVSGANAYNDSYIYDALGNLTSKTNVGLYEYGANLNGTGAGPHQARRVNNQPYTYDANGNLTSGGGRTYTWNDERLPASVASGGVTETYTYDADGERVTRTRNGVTTLYLEGLWDEDLGASRKAIHFPFNGQIVAQRDQFATLHYLHADHLGSVSLSTTWNGNPPSATSQTFTPWGAPRSGSVSATKRNYTGQYRDDTGLLYYHARYYDPVLGRFISPDTLVPDPTDPQDLNRYTYAKNNPMRYNDPTGHSGADVQEFLYGIGAQWTYNNSWFAPGQARDALAAQPGESLPRTVGRHVGNVATAVQGVAEVVGGAGAATGGGAVCVTGVGCLAGAPVAAGGAAVAAHGATTTSVALAEEGKLIWHAITGGGSSSGSGARSKAREAMRNLGLEDVNLAGTSYNSGRKALEKAGFEFDHVTKTGRRVFRHPRTGAIVSYDSGKALVGNQRPHWHIQDRAGNRYDRLGRVVESYEEAGHIPAAR
jgi:RHS repeat-associated protein